MDQNDDLFLVKFQQEFDDFFQNKKISLAQHLQQHKAKVEELKQQSQSLQTENKKATQTLLQKMEEEKQKKEQTIREEMNLLEKEKSTLLDEMKLLKSKGVDEMPSIISLDIGGKKFSTSIQTLTKYETSMLGVMFSGRHKVNYQKDGSVFIDRYNFLFCRSAC